MRVLIAPDKFKGTLTAMAAARAIAQGWKAARPQDELELVPITDGGDGFGQVMRDVWHATARRVRTVDAAGRLMATRWWWSAARKAAVIESAEIIGLAKLPAKRFHPRDLDTSGLATVIRAASRAGTQKCVIGIGGSATNDGGFGLAKALGWKFLDATGHEIKPWTELNRLKTIQRPAKEVRFRELIVAVDVQNPLLGKIGATRIYGPQKGLQPSDFFHADDCLRQLALVTRKVLGVDIKNLPGTGAAGGLGFGLAAFLEARLESGFDLFAHEAGLIAKVRCADLVITGEGCIDRSTVMGKGVGQLAKICKASDVSCIATAGQIRDMHCLGVFSHIAALSEICGAYASMRQPATWLQRLAGRIANALVWREE